MPEIKRGNTAFPTMNRRQYIAASAIGAALSILGLSVGKKSSGRDFIRPPGACIEPTFSALCARCGRCVSACPNSALYLHGFENGIKNFYTPKLVPTKGYCIMPVDGCQKCIEACPVNVLYPIDLEGVPVNHLSKVLKMGTAVLDTRICIPYVLRQPCLACKEICPVDGAITLERGGGPARPVFNQDACVGCGACEYACPTTPKAVAVSSKGEKRAEWKG